MTAQASAAEAPSDSWVVKALYTYPVKSCKGVPLTESLAAETGLEFDRLWMLTYAKYGRFVTQRQEPRLALISVAINREEDKLELSASSMPTTLRLPLRPSLAAGDLGEQHKVRVWYDDVLARSCGEEADSWLTEFVGKPIRLLYKDSASPRLVSRYVPEDGEFEVPPQSGFADVHPFHITTDPSLEDVNRRVPRPLSHLNFRPNIRIEFEPATTGASGSKDGKSWSMLVVARTPRCTMPNNDPETGTMSADREPHVSMKTFRCVDPGKPTAICFGMQAISQVVGQTISVGQRVSVRERGFHAMTKAL
ncbi:hypothetical protein GGI12_003887 [Dipsacomyces acuminosporus]|nr:hypothetical protein GGI12_003887 [Dipsacomyces acuminosporus]